MALHTSLLGKQPRCAPAGPESIHVCHLCTFCQTELWGERCISLHSHQPYVRASTWLQYLGSEILLTQFGASPTVQSALAEGRVWASFIFIASKALNMALIPQWMLNKGSDK